jgi:hypothetical protein
MSNSKPLPVWFGPALIVTGLLSLFGFIKKAKADGLIKDDEKP